jgi:hypothetical protein
MAFPSPVFQTPWIESGLSSSDGVAALREISILNESKPAKKV